MRPGGSSERRHHRPDGGPQLAQGPLSKKPQIITNRVVQSDAEAYEAAKSELRNLAQGIVLAKGRTIGVPDLQNRRHAVRLAGSESGSAGNMSSRRLRIRSAMVDIRPTSPAECKRARFLLSRLHRSARSRGKRKAMDTINGVVIGLVTQVQPARSRSSIPWLSDDHESDWIRIATAMSGNNRGSFLMPELRTRCCWHSTRANPRCPYVVGFLWNGQDVPPGQDSATGA